MYSPSDVTLENAINSKLKLLLTRSFLKVVKLNCLFQNEGGGVENAPGDLDLPLTSLVPCIGMLGLSLGYYFFYLKSSDCSFAPSTPWCGRPMVPLIHNL